jgi:uncharacterized protein
MNSEGDNSTRPRPLATAYSGFYWEGARNGQLLIQRCADCMRYLHPPGPICPRCGSSPLQIAAVSGRGTLHSFTTVRHLFHPAFSDDLPYIIARVELEEQAGLFLVTNLRRCTPEAARTGMPLRVIFERVGLDILPQFIPANVAESSVGAP